MIQLTLKAKYLGYLNFIIKNAVKTGQVSPDDFFNLRKEMKAQVTESTTLDDSVTISASPEWILLAWKLLSIQEEGFAAQTNKEIEVELITQLSVILSSQPNEGVIFKEQDGIQVFDSYTPEKALAVILFQMKANNFQRLNAAIAEGLNDLR